MRDTSLTNSQNQFHAVSLSGGKDSTAMLLLMIERGMPIDMVLYWFSKRGLPWGTRENITFLRNRNYDPADGIQISSESAVKIIEGWGH